MKIAISADGNHLESTIHERFGRCPYFLIIETEDLTVEVIENTNSQLSGGAGIQAASMVAAKGVAAVITGNCGPKAMQVFNEAGVQLILNQHGVIREVVDKFKDGLPASSSRTDVSGMSDSAPPSSPTAMGRGRGRGLGGGGGLGGGRGMGRRYSGMGGSGGARPGRSSGTFTRQGELAQLQQQADECRQQLMDIEARIKALS